MNSNSSSFPIHADFSYSTGFMGSSFHSIHLSNAPFRFPNGLQPREPNRVTLEYIRDLCSPKYQVTRPLALLVTKEADEYKIEYPPLELYAFSDSVEAAIDEIKEEIVDLCESTLSVDESKLGRIPRGWKQLLKSMIKENE